MGPLTTLLFTLCLATAAASPEEEVCDFDRDGVAGCRRLEEDSSLNTELLSIKTRLNEHGKASPKKAPACSTNADCSGVTCVSGFCATDAQGNVCSDYFMMTQSDFGRVNTGYGSISSSEQVNYQGCVADNGDPNSVDRFWYYYGYYFAELMDDDDFSATSMCAECSEDHGVYQKTQRKRCAEEGRFIDTTKTLYGCQKSCTDDSDCIAYSVTNQLSPWSPRRWCELVKSSETCTLEDVNDWDYYLKMPPCDCNRFASKTMTSSQPGSQTYCGVITDKQTCEASFSYSNCDKDQNTLFFDCIWSEAGKPGSPTVKCMGKGARLGVEASCECPSLPDPCATASM